MKPKGKSDKKNKNIVLFDLVSNDEQISFGIKYTRASTTELYVASIKNKDNSNLRDNYSFYRTEALNAFRYFIK